MNAFTLSLWRWLMLALAGCFLVGCTNTPHRSTRALPKAPLVDYRVVESSLSGELTAAQKAQIGTTVEEVIARERPQRSGTYDVRVEFAAEQPGDKKEWVLVRIRYLVPVGYEVVGYYPSGPARSYEYYYDRYGYGIWGENYYDPFYYNFGYYVPPRARDHDFSPPSPGDGDNDRHRRPPPPTVDPTPPRQRPDPRDSAPEFPRRDSPRHRPNEDRNDPKPRDREPPAARPEPLGFEHGRRFTPEPPPPPAPREPAPRADTSSNDAGNTARSTTDSERPAMHGNVRGDRN